MVRIYMTVLAATMIAGLACGGGNSANDLPPELDHPAASAINRLQTAFVEDDYDKMCAGLTRAAARQAGLAGHGDPTTCQRDLRRLFKMIEKGGGLRHAGEPRVTDVESDGSKAVATVMAADDWRARVPMTRVDGAWRLSGFFGITVERSKSVARELVHADFPPAPDKTVRVSNESSGASCPALSAKLYPTPSGGCTIKLASPIMPLTIQTALGDFRFSECSIAYRVRVDSSGRTWSYGFEIGLGPDSKACGDVRPCYDYAAREAAPWRGRIEPDGENGFVHRMKMCMGTCVGYFVGDLTIRLTPSENGWRAVPVDGGGDSGFRFDSPLEVRGDIVIDT